MSGSLLRFYMHEQQRHGHRLLYEWLLEEARALGIRGGSAFRAIAGFGRHGVLHEQHFFELAGDLTVVVELVVDQAESARLLDRVKAEKIPVFFARIPVEFGVLGGTTDEA